MKKIIICLAVFILSSVSGIAPATEQSAAFDGEIVRLHVIANSDSEADQRLKLKVRDAVLNASGSDISEAKDIEGLNAAVKKHLPVLQSAAENVITSSGYDYPVKIEFGVFPFPARTYGNVTFPAADYNAVRVIIGEGKGKNWWCVLFPPLCFTDETYAEGALSAGDKPKFKAKLKIMEVISRK